MRLAELVIKSICNGVMRMTKNIEIIFTERTDIGEISRVRNFAEELSLKLGDLGDLPMDEADAATTRVVIHRIPGRHIGDCQKLIKHLLHKHMMTEEANVR